MTVDEGYNLIKKYVREQKHTPRDEVVSILVDFFCGKFEINRPQSPFDT